MQRPRFLHEAIPRIDRELRLDRKLRGLREAKCAMELPEGIDPQTSSMSEKIVA